MGIKIEKREDVVLVVRRRKDKKYIRKSEYAHVSLFEYKKEVYYKAQISKYKWTVFFLTEKEAAKAVDIKLIEKGQEPVNILKPKKQ
jgi:NACalpha-BTF3-like transcription factor